MKLAEFYKVFALYAKHNPIARSARIAYGIVYRGLPF
jgi:hypothetical protein